MSSTLAEIKVALAAADREQFESLARALAADERKGVKAALSQAKRRLDAADAETNRVAGLYAFEKQLAHGGVCVGLDEVGRGPVAGPLTVAGVVLPEFPQIAGVNDSKQVKPEKRQEIAQVVRNVAIACSIQHVQPSEIDEHGMTWALRTAFGRAIADVEAQLNQAGVQLDCVLLDGNAQRLDPREVNVVKGDGRCSSIAAASIIAKVERDGIMVDYAREYSEYGFDSNKGYASADHIEAIKRFGLSPIHRASFCTAWTQGSLF